MPSALLSLRSLNISLSSFYYFLCNDSIGKGNLHLSLSLTCFLPLVVSTEPIQLLICIMTNTLKTLDYFKYVSLVCICMYAMEVGEHTGHGLCVEDGTTLWYQFSPPISASVPEMDFRPKGLHPRRQVPLPTERSPHP